MYKKTFLINYFELRDGVIKDKEFLWVNPWQTCMWWAMERPILHLNPETCMCSYCFILAIPYNVSSAMVEKYEFSRVKNTWCSFLEILLEWKDICSGVLLLWREDLYKMHKNVHFMSLRFLLCLYCFQYEVPDVKEMR